MRFDSQIIEEIKYRNDISDVISSYVQLTRAGSNYKGLCPFHSEKTPSFTVFTQTKSYYCFGCGKGGDVITFIMQTENLDYPSAVEFLARRAGITLPESNEDSSANAKIRARMYEMNRDAAKFFHSQLDRYPQAVEYVRKRQLSNATVRHFGIGFAPDGFDMLNHMRSLGYTDDELTSGFLCGKSKKNGKLYPYFRSRLMFPIINTSGNVLGFGGRIIGEGDPKYLNTSDTPVFKKSRNLYALNFAAKNSSDRMILCEGYMDVIALHAAGFPFAVATLGTAITEEQARIMKKYTKEVIISYDSDGAGIRAAERAFRLLSEAGVDCRILKIDGAKDPDEYIKSFGGDKFRLMLDKSVSRFDFSMDNILAQKNLSDTETRLVAVKEIAQLIASYNSKSAREIYISKAALRLDITPDNLKSDVEYYVRVNNKSARQQRTQKLYLDTSGFNDRVVPEKAKNLAASKAEETILGIMLLKNEYISKIKSGIFSLSEDDFFTNFGRSCFHLIIENYSEESSFEIGILQQELTAEEFSRLISLENNRCELTNNDAVFADCIATLKKEKAKDSIESLEELINERRK